MEIQPKEVINESLYSSFQKAVNNLNTIALFLDKPDEPLSIETIKILQSSLIDIKTNLSKIELPSIKITINSLKQIISKLDNQNTPLSVEDTIKLQRLVINISEDLSEKALEPIRKLIYPKQFSSSEGPEL